LAPRAIVRVRVRTIRAMSRARAAPSDAPWTTKDVLETLGDAMTRGRMKSLSGDADARNAIQRAALASIIDADCVRVSMDAIDALREGARAHDAGTTTEARWAALRECYDVALRRLMESEGSVDFALADIVYAKENAGDACRVAEARMTFGGESRDIQRWRSLNDGVMGGMSDGFMAMRGDDGASFMGNVSLERNGGFASVRAMVEEDASNFDGVYVDAKSPSGAAKKFLFILKDDECLREQINFKVAFEVGEEYGRVKIPFAAFARPERMGRACLREPLRLRKLREFGLMILKGDTAQVGPFELVVREIGFYRG
jgi:hypothetical protein